MTIRIDWSRSYASFLKQWDETEPAPTLAAFKRISRGMAAEACRREGHVWEDVEPVQAGVYECCMCMAVGFDPVEADR